MQTEKQFEEYLSLRRLELASPGFAERIIGRARVEEAEREISLISYFHEAAVSLFMPKTALSLLGILLIGMAIGISLPVQDAPQEYAVMDEEGIL